MALRGNSPKPDPTSKCPQCGRYFEGERCPNPKCRYERGDLDKRERERRKSRAEQALDTIEEILHKRGLSDEEIQKLTG